MEKLKVISNRLGISKKIIQKLVKKGKIKYEIIDGVIFVDENEVKNVLENSDSDSNSISISIEFINENIFNNPNDCVNYYSLFIENYRSYTEKYNDSNLLNFLNHSVNSNNCIGDRLEESDFIIDHLKYTIDTTIFGDEYKFELYCIFYIGEYKVYISGNRMFFVDEKTNTKYYYYGD